MISRIVRIGRSWLWEWPTVRARPDRSAISASLTASGKTKTTVMIGSASAAAPKLQADLARALGLPSLVTAQPKPGTGTTRNGGPVR